MDNFKLNSIEEALDDFRDGKFVIVVDDEDRENEGDFIIAAEKITPEAVNFMLKNGRGVLCAPITLSRCKELELAPQVSANTSLLGTPFTVTIDKVEGCSTGVSTADRAATIKALADPASKPETFEIIFLPQLLYIDQFYQCNNLLLSLLEAFAYIKEFLFVAANQALKLYLHQILIENNYNLFFEYLKLLNC